MSKKHWLAVLAIWVAITGAAWAAPPLEALIVDGRMNKSHDWRTTSPLLQKQLEETGLFRVDFATAPPAGTDLSDFKPDFAAYDVVVFNYEPGDWPEAEYWSDATKKAFVDYVRAGGGVVIYHTSISAFPGWKECNEIACLGGWYGRNEKAGPYVYWQAGEVVHDDTPGIGGSHGPRHEFQLVVRQPEHPITKGLPKIFTCTSTRARRPDTSPIGTSACGARRAAL